MGESFPINTQDWTRFVFQWLSEDMSVRWALTCTKAKTLTIEHNSLARFHRHLKEHAQLVIVISSASEDEGDDDSEDEEKED